MTITRWLPRDAALPTRDALLDCARVAARVATPLGLAPGAPLVRHRAKYRFGESLRLLLMAHGDRGSLALSCRTGPPPDKREPGVHYDEVLGAAFRVFPSDRKLRVLADILRDPDALAPLLGVRTHAEVAAYAPEKSATLRCSGVSGSAPLAYVKAFAGGEAPSIAAAMRSLGAERARTFALPRVLGLDTARGLLLLAPVRGERLDRFVGARKTRAFARLGGALASLHSCTPPPGLSAFPRLSPNRVCSAAELLARVRPSLEGPLLRLRDELLRRAPAQEATGLLHGDVHPKNALFDGETLALIDFDQLALGSAACDLGSFLASRIYEEITEVGPRAVGDCVAFLDGYARVRPLPQRSVLRWHVAAALLAERGVRALSRLRENGLARMPELVAAGQRTLEAQA